MKVTARLLKITGTVILLVPVFIFLGFSISESFVSGASSYILLLQAVPLSVLALFSWYKPNVGGLATMIVSFLLALVFNLNVALTPQLFFVNEILLFGPPFVAGALFLISTKSNS